MEDAQDHENEKEIVKSMIDSINNEKLVLYLKKYISLAIQSWDRNCE